MAFVASTNTIATELLVRYRLAEGVQVRREKSGLLFYNASGPRLYFLGSGDLLSPEFFESGWQLKTWLDRNGLGDSITRHALAEALEKLNEKGVLHADSGSP